MAVISGNGSRCFCEMPKPRQSSGTKQQGYGVLLDIDGVLVRGRKTIPGAREALEILHQSDVPTVFLTNAGCQSAKLAAKFPCSPILHYVCGSMCVVLCFATKKQQKQRIVPELLHCFCHCFPLTMTCMHN